MVLLPLVVVSCPPTAPSSGPLPLASSPFSSRRDVCGGGADSCPHGLAVVDVVRLVLGHMEEGEQIPDLGSLVHLSSYAQKDKDKMC